MKSITINVEDEIEVNDLINLIKRFYPDKKINSLISEKNNDVKFFSGIDDLRILRKEDFKTYTREELYDR